MLLNIVKISSWEGLLFLIQFFTCFSLSYLHKQTSKSDLISDFFYFGSNLPKKVPNNYPEHYASKEKMVMIVIWRLFFGDFIESEKHYKIKPPLTYQMKRKDCKVKSKRELKLSKCTMCWVFIGAKKTKKVAIGW